MSESPAFIPPEQQKVANGASLSTASVYSSTAPLVASSLWRAIWTMSWPLTLTTMASSLVGIVDVQIAGQLGPNTQAAVGLSEQILFVFMLFIMSLSMGTTSLVSRACGSEDWEEACKATSQSLSLSLVLGAALFALVLLAAQIILPVLNLPENVTSQGQLFLSVASWYFLPFSILSIVNAAFRAIGDAKTPLIVIACMTALNIAGDYLFVFGNFPVPGLGIRGLALASIVSSFISALLALFLLLRSPLKHCLVQLLPVDFGLMKRVIDVGLPFAFQRISYATAVFMLFFILSHCVHPTAAIASWTIGVRVEALLFMPLMGLSLAVSSIVGQNLGARQVRRAFVAGWRVSWIGIVLMLVCSGLLLIFAPQIAVIMSHDATTIGYTISYLRINALSEPFLAAGMILSGALQGAGDTHTPMWISIFGNWIIRLPLAWLLAILVKMGPPGVWIAMFTSITLQGCLMIWRYQNKGWIRTRV